MNRVYKVIWSKAKHCYVVTSEIARSVTKSASSARSAGRKGAAVLAMAALLFTAGGVLGEVAANVTDIEQGSTPNVIMVTKDGGEPTPITIDKVAHATEAVHATASDRATKDGNGVIIDTNYVKNADAEVDAGGTYVKVANTVGKNLSALDANLSALDEQVKKNTKAVVEVGKTADETFTDLYAKVQTNAQAVAAEENARKAADQNNLKVGDDGVISKVTGNDGTTSSAVNTLVLNKDGKNQITLSEDGIKVGLNSGVMDKDGFYAGGDDYEHAGAALKWDGSIKGAAGDFTVDTKGKVTAASGKIGTVEITSAGAVSGVTDLTVTGTFDSKTLSSTLDAKNDYTTINGGKTQSMNWKMDAVTGETQSSASTFDENGSNAWAKDDDSIGKSTVTADGISQKLSDPGDNPQAYAERAMSQGTDKKYSMVDTVKDGDKTNVASQTASESSSVVSGKDNESIIKQTETGIKSTATDGKNNASTNLSNKGFNTFASDGGKNKTYTKQTAESLTSQIGDDGKVKSVMNADGITNITGDNTVISDTNGTTFENKAHNTAVKEGTVTKTTISGNTIETGQAKMDYADVTKDLSVGGNAAVDGNTTLGKEGEDTTLTVNSTSTFNKDVTMKENATVEKDLTVNGESTLTGDVTMKSNATVEKDLTVNGESTLTGDVTMKSNATVEKDLTVNGESTLTGDVTMKSNATVEKDLTVNGESTLTGDVTMKSNATVEKDLTVNGESTLTGDVTMESNATVTKDLTVKGASEFVHRADFRDNVFMDENLTVAKETRTDTLYVDHDGYVGGNLNVEGNIETHDAVLSADSRQVVTGRQLYQTNERVDRLDNRIKKVGANAAALAALRPGDFNPDDKFSIAAGFGSYRNANAAALGLFYRPNENVLLSLGTSFGDGENMVNAGVSVKFGRGKSMAERRKEMADEVSSMRDEMRSQDERIAELEEMLKKQSELIEKLSKES